MAGNARSANSEGRRRTRGIGCLLIEHNVGLVLSVCADVVVLDGGQVIEHGDRAAILASRAVRAAYLGTAEVAA